MGFISKVETVCQTQPRVQWKNSKAATNSNTLYAKEHALEQEEIGCGGEDEGYKSNQFVS